MIILAVVELFITGQWARGLKDSVSDPNETVRNK
ncbi:carbon starvation protein CstA [Brachyspira sp. CAG:700]|nr:carbon starvation protein CstA [Brachyspira sp. CAG:700]